MTMKTNGPRAGLLAATALVGVLALAPAAFAQEAVPTASPDAPTDPRDAQIRELHAELEALAGQVADLKAAVSSGLKDVRETASAQDKVVITGGKPALRSADGKFSAELHGVVQFDSGAYFQHDIPVAQTDPHARDLNDGTNFRRYFSFRPFPWSAFIRA